MVFNKKLERAQNGPGLIEVTFGVLLSLMLGVSLAALYLIFKPVEIVAKPPEAPAPGQVYFVEGAANGGKARQWTRKRQILAEGAPADLTFSEEELNAWISSATPQKNSKAEAEALAAANFFVPERVNFRIQQGVLQMGLVGKFSIFGFEPPLVIQTRGTFEQGASGFSFSAKELYIGSLPTHVVPNLTPWLMNRVFAAQQVPEDLKASWQKLRLVAIEGNVLRLVMP